MAGTGKGVRTTCLSKMSSNPRIMIHKYREIAGPCGIT